MAKKTKSMNNINAQLERIYQSYRAKESQNNANGVIDMTPYARFQKAVNIADKYTKNMENTRSAKATYNKAFEAQQQGDAEKRKSLISDVYNKQYSSNTYMGNSRG